MKPPESFLPDFCSLQTTFVLVLASLLLALVLTLDDFLPAYGFWPELGLHAFFIIWVVLLSGTVLCIARNRLLRLDPVRGGIATFCIVQTVTFTVTMVAQADLAEIGYRRPSDEDFSSFSLRILAASSLVTLAWLRYQYVQARWRAQSRAEALARLDALQARMHPHFLFNSLNTVAALIRENPPMAEELLLDIAEVFRAILRKDAQLVPLADEVSLARQYLRIEHQRLGQRLHVAWDLMGVPEDALIPPLSLQPLLENAIRHGIEISPEGGVVEIGGRIDRKSITLTIHNPLPKHTGPNPRAGNRQAVVNLRARLEACFGDRGRLDIRRADGRYQARITIPYLTEAP